MSRISEYRNRKPKNVIKYITVELYHPNAGLYRFVQNQFKEKSFGLEPTAPRNPSEYVDFKPIAFSATSPSQSTTPSVTSSITVSRVGSGIGAIVKQLQGFSSFTPTEYIWREYLSDDLSEPVLVNYLFTKDISVSRDAFTIPASDTNPMTQGVLELITPDRFPGVIDL